MREARSAVVRGDFASWSRSFVDRYERGEASRAGESEETQRRTS
jgi:hypothetical protein